MRQENVVGEPVLLSHLLARSDQAAVRIQHLTAYPNGFEFQVVAHIRKQSDLWDPMHGLSGFRGRPGVRGGEMADEILRFGIQFADGRKATNLGPPMAGPTDKDKKGPFLQPQGGSGGGLVSDQTFWAWPLPPPGPLAFVCQWPKYGIPETRHEIDAKLILEAAKRAVQLWPDD